MKMKSLLPITLLIGCTLQLETQATTTEQPSEKSHGEPEAAAPLLTQRENVQRFIQRMVVQHNFDRKALTEILNQLTLREKKRGKKTSDAKRKKKMDNPAESRPWAEYRSKHVKTGIINNGVKFWNRHHELLTRAEQEYGVPAHIIMGVLGVETRYGGYTGDDPVVNALATFAFNYPSRERFFTAELEAFLLMAREEKQDPFSYLGSYAGAMGLPQFMPSNYRKLAVDFDHDGDKDIWDRAQPADAIGSIANYLSHHGWKKGEPIASRAHYQPSALSDQHTVTAGDSLWVIAKRVQNHQGGSMGRLMTEIQQLNPTAFVNQDPGQLKLGAVLRLPVATESNYSHLIQKKLRPKYTVSDIIASGFQIDADYPSDKKALLLELKGEQGTEHWVARYNFYVISRYNPRTLYTMAVYQLGEAIHEAYDAQQGARTHAG